VVRWQLAGDRRGSTAMEPTQRLDGPPPPSNRWSARLVHRAWTPDQCFRVRASERRMPFLGAFYRDLLTDLLTRAPCGPMQDGACGPYAAVPRSSLPSTCRCIAQLRACLMHLHWSAIRDHLGRVLCFPAGSLPIAAALSSALLFVLVPTRTRRAGATTHGAVWGTPRASLPRFPGDREGIDRESSTPV
jgi:hypothetical protein